MVGRGRDPKEQEARGRLARRQKEDRKNLGSSEALHTKHQGPAKGPNEVADRKANAAARAQSTREAHAAQRKALEEAESFRIAQDAAVAKHKAEAEARHQAILDAQNPNRR